MYTHAQPQPHDSLLTRTRPTFPLYPTPRHPTAVDSAPADLTFRPVPLTNIHFSNPLHPPTSHSAFLPPPIYTPPALPTPPPTMPLKRTTRPTTTATTSRQRATDKTKTRLARKAELARLSRRRKKAHMAGVMEELERLRRQVGELREANEKGVKWVDTREGKSGSGGRVEDMDDGCDEGSEFHDSEMDEVLEDSPRGALRRSSVTSGSSLSSTSPRFRSRDRHGHSHGHANKRSKRRSSHRYISDSDSDSASCTSDDSDYERRRKHKRAKKSSSLDSITSTSTHTSTPSATSTTTAPPPPPPPSPIVTLQTISLEALDLLGIQPILSRIFLSLPLHTTTFTALRAHLLAQSFHWAGEGYVFVVGRRVVGGGEESGVLSGVGVAGGGGVQLVHRALLSGVVEAGAVGGGAVDVVAMGTAALSVKSEEEEAARAISTLAVAATVA